MTVQFRSTVKVTAWAAWTCDTTPLAVIQWPSHATMTSPTRSPACSPGESASCERRGKSRCGQHGVARATRGDAGGGVERAYHREDAALDEVEVDPELAERRAAAVDVDRLARA